MWIIFSRSWKESKVLILEIFLNWKKQFLTSLTTSFMYPKKTPPIFFEIRLIFAAKRASKLLYSIANAFKACKEGFCFYQGLTGGSSLISSPWYLLDSFARRQKLGRERWVQQTSAGRFEALKLQLYFVLTSKQQDTKYLKYHLENAVNNTVQYAWLTSGEPWFAACILCSQAQGFLRQSERGGGWGWLRTWQGAMDTQPTTNPTTAA